MYKFLVQLTSQLLHLIGTLLGGLLGLPQLPCWQTQIDCVIASHPVSPSHSQYTVQHEALPLARATVDQGSTTPTVFKDRHYSLSY